MGIALLKKLNNSLPDSVKLLGAPFIRRQLIYNKIFQNQLNQLNEGDLYTDSQLKEYQMEKLRDILIHAYEHTIYYKKVFDKIGFDPKEFNDINEFKKIPLLTKEIIQKNYEELQSDDIKDFYLGETGGSSGEPLKLLLDKESIYREKAFIYHFWSKYGYDYKHTRIVTFRGVEFNNKISKINPLYNEMLLNPFVLSEQNVELYIKKIEDFKADYIHGYPSAIANFCRLVHKKNFSLKRKIHAVFLISENCTSEQKQLIETTLKCKTVAFYGHTERAVFAEQEGYKKSYKFNKFYGYTEIQEHTKGNIVCTGFINRKFPLIRYAVDDEAIKVADDSYKVKGHRNGDCLYGRNGEMVTQAALNFHDDTFEKTCGYQIYQDKLGIAQCRVQSEYKLEEDDLRKIKNALERKSNSVLVWDVIQVSSFELTKRVKFKLIIQKCKIDKVSRGGVIPILLYNTPNVFYKDNRRGA